MSIKIYLYSLIRIRDHCSMILTAVPHSRGRGSVKIVFVLFFFFFYFTKNNIIYTTHITILNLQYIIKHYLQYIIKILEILTLFLFTYLFIYLFCFHPQQTNRQKTKQIPKLTCTINWGYNSYFTVN